MLSDGSHLADTRPAPGLPEQDQWEGLTIPMLKHELQKRGLPVKGTKRTLVGRIREAAAVEQQNGTGVKPGILGIDAIATKEVSCLPFCQYCPPLLRRLFVL